MNSDVYNVNADGINEKSDLFFSTFNLLKKINISVVFSDFKTVVEQLHRCTKSSKLLFIKYANYTISTWSIWVMFLNKLC